MKRTKDKIKWQIFEKVYAFGAILYDAYGEGKVLAKNLGGAPFNFAYYLHQLGVQVSLISCIGQDEDGDQILKDLERLQMDTAWIGRDKSLPTGIIRIHNDAKGNPTFDIPKSAAYDAISNVPTELGNSILYYGTSDWRSSVSKSGFLKFVESRKESTLCFCDLNLRHPYFTAENIRLAFSFADVLKINRGELEIVMKLLKIPGSLEEGVQYLSLHYKIRWILLTDGEKGAALYDVGVQLCEFKTPSIKRVVDATGAGDAFCAGFLHYVLAGKNFREALDFAVKLATYVCEFQGASISQEALKQFVSNSSSLLH